MVRITKTIISALAVTAVLAVSAADVSAAPRRAGVAAGHSGARVAQGRGYRGGYRGGRRGGYAGPAIAGAALGLLGAGVAAAIAGSQQQDYYGPQSYYGPGPGYGQGYYAPGYAPGYYPGY
jgi:hypothetical protein